MCGIGGYYQIGNNKQKTPGGVKPALRKLWDSLQERGSDAAGIAYESPTGTRHFKRGIPAFELSPLALNMCFSMNRGPRWIMLHTRAATHGRPEINNNNHPLMGYNLALCHNGVIHNKEEVLKHFDIEAQRTVDTEAVLVALKRGGINAVSRHVKGSMSLSWGKGKALHLWTNGLSPLVIGELATGDYVYASTDRLLMTTGLKFKRVFDAKAGYLYKFTRHGLRVRKTYFKQPLQPVYTWRDASGHKCTMTSNQYVPKKINQYVPKKITDYVHENKKRACNTLMPDIDYSLPEEEKTELQWEAVYGDWRSWSGKRGGA